MAEKVIVHLIDDITGQHGEDVTLVQFALDGVDYEIDLSTDNAAALRAALAEYIAVARKATTKRQPTTSSSNGSSGNKTPKTADRKAEIKAIREWAQGKFDISDRGRIPQAVEQAYAKAMQNGGTEQQSPENGNGQEPEPIADDTVVDAEILDDNTVVDAEILDAKDTWQRGNGIPVAAFSG